MDGDSLKIMPSLASVVWLTIVTIVGFAVWVIQRRLNAQQKAREDEATKKETARLKEIAERERERAEREKEARETIAAGHQVVLNRLTELEKNESAAANTLSLLKQEMLPMAEAMKRKLVEILTHPSDEFKTPDALLAQVKVVGAHMPDELKPFLAARINSTSPHVGEYEKLAAEGLSIITRMAELEARDPHLKVTGVQLVSSTVKSAETKKGEEGH